MTLTASDGAKTASQNFDWTVSRLLVTNPGDQANYDGDVVSLPITADDNNAGDALSYAAAELPAGLNINAATGLISGTIAQTADADGPYDRDLTATGGGATSSATFTWTISNPVSVNNPGDQTNAVGDDVYVPTGGDDASGGTLTFSASNLPPGLSIDPGSGDITGTAGEPADDGVPSVVTVTASDGTYSASENFNWTVTHVFVVNPGDQQNADGDYVILPINAGENDGTAVTVTAVGLPPGLSVNSADNIVGTISNTADLNSPYTVTVSATDGTYSDSQTFNWTVTRLLVTNPGDQTNNDGDVVSLQIVADDNLGDALSYTATGLPDGLSINASTGLISGTIAPAADADGPYVTTVTATGGGASNSQTFNWTVNNPIAISPPLDQSNALGDVVSVPVSATTATGDTLTYSATSLPPGVSINSSTGLISGTIANTASITTPYEVTVTVNDGAISASSSFVWTVGYLTLTNPGDQTNASGDSVSLPLTASDNMGDALTYNANGLPPGLNINPTTGVISGVIALNADANGPYTVTASVTGGGYTASQTFTWNVARILITDPGDQNSADNDTVSLQIGVTYHLLVRTRHDLARNRLADRSKHQRRHGSDFRVYRVHGRSKWSLYRHGHCQRRQRPQRERYVLLDRDAAHARLPWQSAERHDGRDFPANECAGTPRGRANLCCFWSTDGVEHQPVHRPNQRNHRPGSGQPNAVFRHGYGFGWRRRDREPDLRMDGGLRLRGQPWRSDLRRQPNGSTSHHGA